MYNTYAALYRGNSAGVVVCMEVFPHPYNATSRENIIIKKYKNIIILLYYIY